MNSDSFLTRHLKDAREGYVEHLLFAWKVGGKMVFGGLAAIIHGALPFIFCTTGSRTIAEIQDDIEKRRAANEARNLK